MPARAPEKPRNGRYRHYQQHARHGQGQAKAHRHRRRLPHLRSQIDPDTVLRLTATQMATLWSQGPPGRQENHGGPPPQTHSTEITPQHGHHQPPAAVRAVSNSILVLPGELLRLPWWPTWPPTHTRVAGKPQGRCVSLLHLQARKGKKHTRADLGSQII